MSPDEYIASSEGKLNEAEEPISFLVIFYCNLFEVKHFKGIYPAITKLARQFGSGIVFDAITENYYKGKKYSKSKFYQDILFTAMNIQKRRKEAETAPTSMYYTDYLKLRESANA